MKPIRQAASQVYAEPRVVSVANRKAVDSAVGWTVSRTICRAVCEPIDGAVYVTTDRAARKGVAK
jgi:hypothetical protein